MQELSPAVNTRAILCEQRRLLPCHHSVSAADSCLSHRDKLLTLEKLTEMRIEFMVMTMAFQGLLNMLSPSENFKFLFFFFFSITRASLVIQILKNLPAIQEIHIPSLGWADSSGEGNGNPFQYSCLENSMDRGDW